MATRSTMILRRTMVVDQTRGRFRILDFCIVYTSLGMMIEPANIFPKFRKAYDGTRETLEDFGADDAMAPIDDIQFIDGRERFQIQNPVYYGDALNWSCIHDFQLFQVASEAYTQFTKEFDGPAGA